MTSPYSSNLLQKSSFDEDAPRSGASTMPRPQVHTRSTTHVVHAPQPQPQPMYAQQPQQQPMYAPQPRYVETSRGGSGIATGIGMIVLALIIVLVGAIALVGGYYATRQASPTAGEANAQTSLAMREGYAQGRMRGLGQGRVDGAAAAGTNARLSAATARQKAWDAAYQKGLRAGERGYRAPRNTGYRGGSYRAPNYSYPRMSETAAALGAAQNLANISGAPVDVQVFG